MRKRQNLMGWWVGVIGCMLVFLGVVVWRSQVGILGVQDKEKRLRVVFGGDVMWDRYIRQRAEKMGYEQVLADLVPILSNADLVMVNLEGPITDNDSVSKGSDIGSPQNYVFTFDPAVVGVMMQANVGLVSLGNNHILNFGQTGLEKTRAYLQEAGITYVGDVGRGNLPLSQMMRIEGVDLGVVSYNQFLGNGVETVMSEVVKLARVADVVVVYCHWGSEYTDKPSGAVVDLAHRFIVQGADLIIGTHPHVIQTKEEYKGKTIYYSLGNLVFDQYFDERTRKGWLVEVELDPKGGYTTKEYGVRMKLDGRSVME